ncbi:MAG: pyruvate formate lyase family protein [Eubacteriales bacterium]
MQLSERIQQIGKDSVQAWHEHDETHFNFDYHNSAITVYSKCPLWEKAARSMAFAITNQEVIIKSYDKLIGRIYYYGKTKPCGDTCPDFNHSSDETVKNIYSLYPYYDEMISNRLVGSGGIGHVNWAWEKILFMGTDGLKKLNYEAAGHTHDQKAKEYYSGVVIMLDAVEEWNEKHCSKLRELGMTEMADICSKVPKYPAESFHEALQSFFMQYIVVMSENPYGGNGIGRLDYLLWPYLKEDLKNCKCTMEEARELICELLIRIDERIHDLDGWVEALVVGGSYANRESAVNPLSYILIECMTELNITHPSVYCRMPFNPDQKYIDCCADYMKRGNNRAQVFSDRTITDALIKSGVTPKDAAEYFAGGCMEVGVQGMNSDFMFNGWFSVPKILELVITGGQCLLTGNKINCIDSAGLKTFDSFDKLYKVFMQNTRYFLHAFITVQDIMSERAETVRPAYLLSSMIDDCYTKGRNMHGGGARYHDYGTSPVGLANASDSLYAIKKAVFEDKLCTAEELMNALKSDFIGYETLQDKLKALPKYGQENADADEMMARLTGDISSYLSSSRNRLGGRGKIVILTFVWAPEAAERLGATPDGQKSGMNKLIAHGVTPQTSAMTEGITAAINSCLTLPQDKFNGGASTMWDMDPSWATTEVISAIIKVFTENGGQILQGNTTDVNELIRAQKNPELYKNLIVRVGGFSARFVLLSKALQDDIISRRRHKV